MLATPSMPVRFRLQELLGARTPAMKQTELAARSGVSLVTVNAIANNRTRQVSLETLDRLSRALGVPPGDLFEQAPAGKGRRG